MTVWIWHVFHSLIGSQKCCLRRFVGLRSRRPTSRHIHGPPILLSAAVIKNTLIKRVTAGRKGLLGLSIIEGGRDKTETQVASDITSTVKTESNEPCHACFLSPSFFLSYILQDSVHKKMVLPTIGCVFLHQFTVSAHRPTWSRQFLS